MVALLGLGNHALVLGELFLAAESDAVDAREHLVVLVAFPIRARYGGQFERLERLGVADVRADAHVDVFALLIERDARVLKQVADVLDLVLLAAFFHERDRFGARELEDAEFQVLLADLLHLGFDGGEVLFGDFRVGEVDVVVEPVIGGGTVAEVGFGIQALDRLRHDVGGGVAQNVELFVLGAFGDRSVVIQDLHGNSPCTYDAADGLLPACGALPSALGRTMRSRSLTMTAPSYPICRRPGGNHPDCYEGRKSEGARRIDAWHPARNLELLGKARDARIFCYSNKSMTSCLE